MVTMDERIGLDGLVDVLDIVQHTGHMAFISDNGNARRRFGTTQEGIAARNMACFGIRRAAFLPGSADVSSALALGGMKPFRTGCGKPMASKLPPCLPILTSFGSGFGRCHPKSGRDVRAPRKCVPTLARVGEGGA